MIPGTGSESVDRLGEIALVVLLVLTLVLLIRNYRGR
jgi:hypothetical protein